MSPRSRGPRTKCPPSGQDVPLLFNAHSCCEVATCGSVSGEMGLTELECDHLYDYAAFGRYPTGSSKNQRRIIQRKCIKHFRAEDGVLYYSAVGTTQAASCPDRNWKVMVRMEKERRRIIESCHTSFHCKCTVGDS